MNKDDCLLLAERWSIFCSRRILIKYPSYMYVFGILVNCRWYISQFSVVYQSTVNRISLICWLSVKCVNLAINGLWILGDLSVKCCGGCSEVQENYHWTKSYLGWISTDYQPIINGLLTHCWLMYRLTVSLLSTDILVKATHEQIFWSGVD